MEGYRADKVQEMGLSGGRMPETVHILQTACINSHLCLQPPAPPLLPSHMACLRAFAEAVAQRVGTAMAVTPAELQDITVTKMGQDGLCGCGGLRDRGKVV